MARFEDFELEPGARPQTAWATLVDLLLEGESVEVVVEYDDDDRPAAFVLRVWDDVRTDDSNHLDADPDEDY